MVSKFHFYSILAAALMLAGCTSSREVRCYRIEPVVLMVASRERVQEEWDKNTANSHIQVDGFFDPFNNVAWVKLGEDGRPDFATLGEEVWHQPQLGGNWHK
jgi:hypothetical protein